MKKQQDGGEWNNIIILVSFIDAALGITGRLIDSVFLCVLAQGIILLLIIKCISNTNSDIKSLKWRRDQKRNRLEMYIAEVKEKKALAENITSEMYKKYDREEADYMKEMSNATNTYNDKKKKLETYRKKTLQKYIIVYVIVFLVGVRPISAAAMEMIHKLGESSREGDSVSSAVDNPNIPSESIVEDKMVEEVEEKEEKGNIIPDMTFYLDDFNTEQFMTSEQEAAVFYIEIDNSDADTKESVYNHVKGIMDQGLEDTFTYMASEAEKELAAEASNLEYDFDTSRKKVSQYAVEGDYVNWKSWLRHSSDLDDIINKRLTLWNSGRRNGDIASLIANNKQDYALENQRQRGSANTILYYYAESIIWSEKALSYEWANHELIFNYIKARYKDIADYSGFSDSIRLKAQKIYDAMGEYSDYIN